MTSERILITAGVVIVGIATAAALLILAVEYAAARRRHRAASSARRARSNGAPLVGTALREWRPADGYPLPPIEEPEVTDG